MSYQSMEEARMRCEKEKIPFWKAVQIEDADERGVSLEDSWKHMGYMWQSMKDNLEAYEPDRVSTSGLVGTEGGLMDAYGQAGDTLCGGFMAKVMSNALKMGCNNACMKRIVAAPTAGACGVLPAVLVTYYKEYQVSEDTMIEAMYVAAGLGQIIANRAYLAGASGGCQAEIGSGSGMAAGAICHVKGADVDVIGHALFFCNFKTLRNPHIIRQHSEKACDQCLVCTMPFSCRCKRAMKIDLCTLRLPSEKLSGNQTNTSCSCRVGTGWSNHDRSQNVKYVSHFFILSSFLV